MLSALIIIALFFFVLIIIFFLEISQEYQFISRRDASALIEKQIISFFVPYSGQQRIEVLQKYIEDLTNIQNRLSHSLLAKYFIDYSSQIEQSKEELQERIKMNEASTSDIISFSTSGHLIMINATPDFNPEELLEIGDLLDENDSLSELEVNSVYFDYVDAKPFISLSISLDQLDEKQKDIFQNLINSLSKEIFESKQIQLQVKCLGSSESSIDDIQSITFTSAR